MHVWGCPIYVLQKRLSDGKSIGRWEPRSTRYIHMGFSDQHSKTVPLVLNPETGSITPQWNVTFDDYFTTVSMKPEDLPDFNGSEWNNLFGTHTCHFPAAAFDELDPMDSADSKMPSRTHTSEEIADSKPDIPLACPSPSLDSTTFPPSCYSRIARLASLFALAQTILRRYH